MPTIRRVRETDWDEWLRLRAALWPDHPPASLVEEMLRLLAHVETEPVFVAERPGGGLGGLVEVALHDTAPGCTTSPVGYLEAWYVDPDLRRQGIGRRLVGAADAWARAQGCREMASDTTPDYPLSPNAHGRLGYEPTETPFHYRKVLTVA